MKKDSKWYIVPRMIIDREKYRGRGRPRKGIDYRVYSAENDLIRYTPHSFSIEDKKGWIMSRGSA